MKRPRPRPLQRSGPFLCLLTLLVPFLPASAAHASSDPAGMVDPDHIYVDDFEGWGTASAWGADVVGGWSDDKRKEIADLLFDKDKGLGLNVFRYHIGAGKDPNDPKDKDPDPEHPKGQVVGCGDHRPGSPLPAYQSQDGEWDWTADANQRRFAQAAKARGVNRWLAYASSPPWWMTANGCSNGGENGVENLNSDQYAAFANYLTEVTKHFRDSEGITFDLLNPLNEPEYGWAKDGNQEGAYFSWGSQDKVINAVGKSLADKGLTGTKVAASDSQSVRGGISNFNNYSDSAKDYISTLTTHTYWGSENDQVELRNTAAQENKKVWMSEFGTGEFGLGETAPPRSDPPGPDEVQPAVKLAKRIVGDMRHLSPQAWILWDGLESCEQNEEEKVNWGAIWYKSSEDCGGTKEPYIVAKQYYGYQNFTKFIRPGYRIIESGDDQTLAAYDPKSDKLVLVAYNDQETSRSLTYNLGKFDGITKATPHRTSDTEELKQLPDTTVSNNQLSATLNPKSITTYVMSSATAKQGLTSINDRNTGTGRNQFEYSRAGDWSTIAQSGAYLGDNSWSGATNASYQVRFNGTKADLYGAKSANHGIAAVSIDGGPETDVDFYSSTRRDNVRVYSSPTLTPGNHTLKVRVKGTKNAQSGGVYIPADRVDVTQPGGTKVNDSAVGTGTNQFEYDGSWSYGARQDAYGADNHWSGATAVEYYKVRFNGTKLDLYGAKASNHGIAAVSIDGGPETDVDLYAPTRRDNVLVWSSPVLSAGDHTLKVRVTATKNASSSGVYIPADRVDVFP